MMFTLPRGVCIGPTATACLLACACAVACAQILSVDMASFANCREDLTKVNVQVGGRGRPARFGWLG